MRFIKLCIWIFLLVAVAGAQTYSTDFVLNEDPISEGGKWLNGGVLGLDWNNVSSAGDLAFGDDPGVVAYADAWALLAGTWGSDQLAQATVIRRRSNSSCHQELELILRGNLAAHVATGYEISVRAADDATSYLIIVRWNGPIGDFTYLTARSGRAYGVKTGDLFRATIVGSLITAYINGVEKAQVTDETYDTGHPGMGFYLDTPSKCAGTNMGYGYTSYAADGAVNGALYETYWHRRAKIRSPKFVPLDGRGFFSWLFDDYTGMEIRDGASGMVPSR